LHTLEQPLQQALELHQAGHLDAAEALYRRILEAEPRHSEALHFLGVAAFQRGDNEAAVDLITQAIHWNGTDASLHANLGLVLKALGRLEEAAASYRRALQLHPDMPATHFNLGNLLLGQARYQEAAQCYRDALRLDPQYEDARWHLANVLLALGNYREGWAAFEARRSAPSLDESALAEKFGDDVHLLRPRTYDKPLWQGEDLRGKRLLVHFEYGYGDTLQFVRYVPLLAERGARVFLEAQAPLRGLLQRMHGLSEFIVAGELLPEYELHCPLLSLPLRFGTTVETVPAKVPYLQVDAQRLRRWEQRLRRRKALNVAVVWSPHPHALGDRRRSIALSDLWALGRHPHIAFYGLQKRDTRQTVPRALDWTDLGEEIQDFSDTAAILKNMDLLISIDSGPAHLGGALAVPVWLLLPYNPEWRWLLQRDDSPWYPTLRLFRQPRPEDWEAVLARVRTELHRAADESARRRPAWLRWLRR
jgi:tetratricopeptide (TPR) repeat protein